MLPLSLQIRSYLKFASPHKITESFLIPPEANRETANLTTLCPVEGFHMGQIGWNIEVSHYYNVKYGQLCHFIVPQYNTHGNYLMGSTLSNPSPTTPACCANYSIPFEQYLYHGSIGYFSFYEEADGTYCTEDKTAYIRARALRSIDINGSALARYTGSEGYIWSRWYCLLGLVWLTFRMLVLRRSFISRKRHGRLCDQMGQELRRQTAMVFVHESLKLSAHGATNYHRLALLYFLVEGVMTDHRQRRRACPNSSGYNLSGLLLLLFEIIENMKWMREKLRFLIKRLLFCYESSMLGEVIGAAGQEHFISVLN